MTLALQCRPLRKRACSLPMSHFYRATPISTKYILVYFIKGKKQWLVNNGCLYIHQQSFRGFLLSLYWYLSRRSRSSLLSPPLLNHLFSMKEFSNGNIQTQVQNISEAVIPSLRFHKMILQSCHHSRIRGTDKLWNSTQLFLYGATKAIEVSKPVKSSLESQMTSQYIPPCQHYAASRHWKQPIRPVTCRVVAWCPKSHNCSLF